MDSSATRPTPLVAKQSFDARRSQAELGNEKAVEVEFDISTRGSANGRPAVFEAVNLGSIPSPRSVMKLFHLNSFPSSAWMRENAEQKTIAEGQVSDWVS